MKKLSNFIKWNIHGSFRKFLIPREISAKLFLWGRSWDNGTLTFLKVWVLLLDLNSVVYFITWMPWFPRHYSTAWENAAKLILWGELGNLVSIFFNRYECFHGILWYISSHVKWMGVPTNLRQIFRNIHPIGRAWNIGTCIFPKVWMFVFDHILTLYFACDDKLHHIRNAWIFPWISHRMRKRSKARIIGNI